LYASTFSTVSEGTKYQPVRMYGSSACRLVAFWQDQQLQRGDIDLACQIEAGDRAPACEFR
jgi:hypothetical protein